MHVPDLHLALVEVPESYIDHLPVVCKLLEVRVVELLQIEGGLLAEGFDRCVVERLLASDGGVGLEQVLE